MAYEFKLPDIGEGVVEGEIVTWLVKEGDQVAEDQPIVEVLTDKATVVIPSPKAGTVQQIPWKAGDIVPVGKTLIVLSTDGAAAPQAKAEASTQPAKVDAAPKPKPEPKQPEPEPEPKQPEPEPEPKQPEPEPEPKQPEPVTLPPAPPSPTTPATVPDERVLAAPATRRVARELGVDIHNVHGTGKGGRITKEDVERVKAAPTTPAARAPIAPQPPAAGEVEERIPLRGLRKAIAENMVKSMFTAPHFTYVEEIDATKLVALRERLRPLAKARGTDLSYLPIIMKAITIMLREHPMLNASLDDATKEIVLKKYYHLGIAVATDRGLIVPVVRDVDKKGFLELSAEVTALADKARALKLDPQDVKGSTFSITSLGKLGGIMATPIINPGEVAIIGVHRMFERPVWVEDHVEPRQLMNLSLSFDHRVVDGYVGALAVQRLKELLEEPDLFMLELT